MSPRATSSTPSEGAGILQGQVSDHAQPFHENPNEENETERTFAMPAWTAASGIGTQRSLMMAILLFRYLDAERGVHERLGIFKLV